MLWKPQEKSLSSTFAGKYLATDATDFSFAGKMTIYRNKWEGTYVWNRTVVSKQDFHEQNSSTYRVAIEDFWV